MQIITNKESSIYLRPMQASDTNDIIRWRNNDKVRKNFIYQELFTVESHTQWIEKMIQTKKAIQMIICEKPTDHALGSVYIRDIDDTHSKAEYGIFIGEDAARGKGVGTNAAQLMIQYVFEELKLHKLFLRVFASNKQAIKSYEKAGFVQEAYLHDDVYIEGKYEDMILMAIVNTNRRKHEEN